MAIRPPVTPKWATSSYGNDDLAWEEAKRECRDALHEWCARHEPHAYVDLIARVRAIPWQPGDHSSGQLGYLLGQVSLEELDPTEDRPVISSVVIASGKNEPSHGYWAFLEDDLRIRVPVAAREAFWLKELDRCFEAYGRSRRGC
jgi:hypothetical protein